jgi:antibiotic biosynthesis monooxygenase (ABM) superfamily enzyme
MSETSPGSTAPIHVVIVRRVRPGCEAQFQQELRRFFQESFGHDGVLGASMLVPPPGSGSREFGILRTFKSERDRDAFYASALFRDWLKRGEPLAEDEWSYRELSGMEAWFRAPSGPPPRWKMALLTWLAVWPASLLVRALFGPGLGRALPPWLLTAVSAAGVVALLTWVVMPLYVRAARGWLRPPLHPRLGEERRMPAAASAARD